MKNQPPIILCEKSYDYAYDPIGNRTSATEYDERGAPLVAEYAANELNQYAARTVPGYAAVRGEAPPNAFVTVDERPAARTGAYFFGDVRADNTASDLHRDLEIYAAINPSGTNLPDTVYAVTSSVFVAKTPETFTYDADGNMTSDGRFTYTWNADNRMVMASNDAVVVTYAYDHRGRMVRKEISRGDAEPQSIFYTWDDWNIIRETLVTRHSSLVTHNVWGLDLDGTLQGAGGVGGLLAVVKSDVVSTNSSLFTHNSSLYFPCYDANGNITEYVTTNGEVVAHYDYSPFGEQLVVSGPLAATFTHRFSTKPWCADTGLSEYQMRKYRPDLGRWVSRDPIGEGGEINLLAIVQNHPTSNLDYLGLDCCNPGDVRNPTVGITIVRKLGDPNLDKNVDDIVDVLKDAGTINNAANILKIVAAHIATGGSATAVAIADLLLNNAGIGLDAAAKIASNLHNYFKKRGKVTQGVCIWSRVCYEECTAGFLSVLMGNTWTTKCDPWKLYQYKKGSVTIDWWAGEEDAAGYLQWAHDKALYDFKTEKGLQ